MVLHPQTMEALSKNKVKYSETIQNSISKLIDLIIEYSPMSDVNYILYKTGIKLPGLGLRNGDSGSWMPIRNVGRLLAKVSTQDYISPITFVEIETMECGCDYFQGKLVVSLEDGSQYQGKYRWQWTAFSGNERSFDKFTTFPIIHKTVIASD